MDEAVSDIPPAPIELRSPSSGVYLRSFCENDAQELYDLIQNDPNQERKISSYKSVEDIKNLIVCDKDEGRLRFSARNSKNILIGNCYIQSFKSHENRSKIAGIGYYFGKDYLLQEDSVDTIRLLCTYGFENLKLGQIQIVENKDNILSIRILEKIGFKKSEISPLTGKPSEKYLYFSLTPSELIK